MEFCKILFQIEHPHSRDDGLLGDYCDGEDFKSHPLFSSDPHALQILLFFDELEVCNPLGSRANKHKIGMIFQIRLTVFSYICVYIKVYSYLCLPRKSLLYTGKHFPRQTSNPECNPTCSHCHQ